MSQKRKKRERKIHKLVEAVKSGIIFQPLDFWARVRQNLVFLGLMTLVIFGVYANGISADFVSDDYATLLNNPEIATWKYGFQNGGSAYIINTLVAKIFGVYEEPYHAASLVLYLVIFWISYVIVDLLFGKIVAYFSMVLFAVHPIHVESVTWISGKPYLLIAFYIILAWLFFIKYLEKENIYFLLLSGLMFVLGFLTDNPRPFSLFLILGLYLVYKSVNISKLKIFKLWPVVLVFAVIIAIIAWPNIQARIQAVNSGYNSSESIFYNPFFQYPTGVSKYLQLLWFPIDLTLYHTMYVFPWQLNWLILINYLALVVYYYFKDKRYFFALSFFFAALLPSIMPIKVSWLVAERYGFLASLGWCMFLGLIMAEIYKKYKYVAIGLTAIFCIYWSVRLIDRNDDWTTNHKLWVNTCQVSPNSHNAWNNIGDDYDKLKQYDNAIKGFTQSTVIKPNYADAFHNRANIFFKIGRLDLARDSYMIALHYSPTLYQTYLSLINIDLMEKKMDLALEHARKSMELQPGSPQAAYVLAVVHLQREEIKEGEKILEEIVRVAPNFTQAKDLLTQIKSGAIK